MRGAVYTNPMAPTPVTGRSFGRFILAFVVIVLLALAAVGGFLYLRRTSPTATAPAEKPVRTWKSQSVYPQLEKDPVVRDVTVQALPTVAAAAPDTVGPRLEALERQSKDILHKLETLQHPPVTRAAVPTPPRQAPRKDTPKPPAPALLITNKVDPSPAPETTPLYTLAPGATKIPFVLETKIISDVEGKLTGRVTTNVYDTATGRHLLIPQGSTILGDTQSSKLVYGNERLDTVTLKLAFPDGRSVDLDRAPITDQEGVSGMGGDVNQHYGRLLAAVLIQGVLKGGTTSISVAANEAAGVGHIASSIAGLGTQAGTRITGPLLSTKPTITVEAGQLGNVILLQELKLPEMWANGEPQEAPKPKPAATHTSTHKR
jgi:type IV secretory pathway VirB10-like protein